MPRTKGESDKPAQKRTRTSRPAARVMLLDREASSMLDTWVDYLQLRRTAKSRFEVWATKYGEDPQTGKRRMFEWEKIKNLRTPIAIRDAIEENAEFLGVNLEWEEIIPLIASIDWISAAVIASRDGYMIPELPTIGDLEDQRSLRSLGRVRLGAEWGYDMHDVNLPFKRWLNIIQGEDWVVNAPYWYEGKRFTGTWTFDGLGGLTVSYGDGGEGWAGDLESLNVIEGPKIDGVDLARLALHASL